MTVLSQSAGRAELHGPQGAERPGSASSRSLPTPRRSCRRSLPHITSTYPLLSDIGGKVIEAFGLLNPNIPPNPRQATGQPFPGHFLIAPDGDGAGEGVHRRPAPPRQWLRARARIRRRDRRGGRHRRERRAHACGITLSSTRLFGGQEIAVAVDLDIVDGWHVYAESVARAVHTALDRDRHRWRTSRAAALHDARARTARVRVDGRDVASARRTRPHRRPSAPSMEPAAEHVRRSRRSGEPARDHAR